MVVVVDEVVVVELVVDVLDVVVLEMLVVVVSSASALDEQAPAKSRRAARRANGRGPGVTGRQCTEISRRVDSALCLRR